MIGESGFESQAGRIVVSGYSGVYFEIKFSGRHRGFDGVLFNLCPLANTGFIEVEYLSLLEALITDGLLPYAWPVINDSVHMHC